MQTSTISSSDLPKLLKVWKAAAQEERQRGANQAERIAQSGPGGLLRFVRYFWRVLEPNAVLVDGWPLEALCLHLEAVSRGEIKRLLINVPPGFMKSMLIGVFWPAWEWGPLRRPWTRFLAFAYAAGLTTRDNEKFRNLMMSQPYRDLWGEVFSLVKIGETKVSNDQTGWKLATSEGGVGTGERGDRVTFDDPHNVTEAESDTVRRDTVRFFQESFSNRVNSEESAILVIMQRVAEEDVSGAILSDLSLDYDHLLIPMEWEVGRAIPPTSIGWRDPRTQEGELAWPQRFSPEYLKQFKARSYMWASQYQQSPEPRGGGIFKHSWWRLWGNQDDPADPKYRVFPELSFSFASIDTAFTTNEENDLSAFTMWGIFSEQEQRVVRDLGGAPIVLDAHAPRMILLRAWKDHLDTHTLVRRVYDSCVDRSKKPMKLRVSTLLIENKANGRVVAEELERQFGTLGFRVELINPPSSQDKVARAYAVQHLWEQGMVYRPDRQWAVMVEDDMAVFPRGGKDITDSATQAAKYVRDLGLLVRDDERSLALSFDLQLRTPQRPLYPV